MPAIRTHTINVQSSKLSHSYPTIRPPRAFKEFTASKAEIYPTTHEGDLSLLVKVIDHSRNKLIKGSNHKEGPLKGVIAIVWRRIPAT